MGLSSSGSRGSSRPRSSAWRRSRSCCNGSRRASRPAPPRETPRYTACMKRRLLIAAGGLLAALLCANTLPQPAPATPAGPPLYQVEVLIFAYRDFDANEERFEHETPPPGADEGRRP